MRLTKLLLLSVLVTTPAVVNADIVPVPAADAAYGARDYAKAAKLWDEACRGGNATGCFELAIMYRDGEGMKVDEAKMLSLYEQACKGQDGRGCFNLSFVYAEGRGVAKDAGRATAYLQQGCDAKFMPACANLGSAYSMGAGVTKDFDRAVAEFTKACDNGAGPACFSLSALYDGHEKSVVREDPALANVALAKGCDLGEADACQNLGYHYRVGYGVPRNQLRSASLYSAACDNATSVDCVMLSRKWFVADVPRYPASDVSDQYREVAGIYRAACDDRFAQGCLSLGLLVWRTGKNCTAQRDHILELTNHALALNPAYPLAIKFLARIKKGDCPQNPL